MLSPRRNGDESNSHVVPVVLVLHYMVVIQQGMIQQGRHDPARAFRFYVTNHHGRHDPARKEKLAIKIVCAVSVTSSVLRYMAVKSIT